MTETSWTPEELVTIADTQEVHVCSVRPDGSRSSGMTIWAVSVGGAVFIRSFIRSTDGPHKPWFRAAKNRGRGELVAGSSTYCVRFVDASDADRVPIDAEYRRKYRRSPAYNVGRAAGSMATLQLIPVRSATSPGDDDGLRR
jgi:hypothetical protein